MEINVSTVIGNMVFVLEQEPITGHYTGWLKEHPMVIVQGTDVNDSIENLHESLEVWIDFLGDETVKSAVEILNGPVAE